MAKNTGRGHRNGSGDNRTQFRTPHGNWAKRDARTGRIMGQKTTGGPFKSVAREPDERRDQTCTRAVVRFSTALSMPTCICRFATSNATEPRKGSRIFNAISQSMK